MKSIITDFGDKNAVAIAENLGRIFFNVLRLECAEPQYPQVCLHYTETFPGSLDPQMPVGTNGNAAKNLQNVPKERLWFNLFEEESSTEEKMWEGRCVEWVKDTSATPTLVFKKPKRLF